MPTYRFGDWMVEPDRNRIASGDLVRQLEPRSMDILVHLLENPHATVSTESLLDIVWAERVVEPNAVHRCITQIRQALGDDSHQPSYIETIRKRGYRAIGPIERVTLGTSSDDGASSDEHLDEARAKHFRSWPKVGIALLLLVTLFAAVIFFSSQETVKSDRVAVLPLRYLGTRANLEYLATGLTIEITNRLRAGLVEGDALTVLPEPVVRGKSIDEIVDLADIVAYGTLRDAGDDAIVSINVLRLSTNTPVWSGEVRGQLENPYLLQQQIAGHLARMFSIALRPYQAPKDPQAYSAYLKFIEAGPAYGDHGHAMYWLDRALQRQPDWTIGWASVLGYKLAEYFYFGNRADLVSAELALERLETLDAPEVPWGRAHIAAYGYADWESAEPFYRRVAPYEPFWYANLMLEAGLYHEAEIAARQALDARPYATFHLQLWEVVALARANLGDFQGAAAAFKEIVLLTRPDASVNTRIIFTLFEGRDADIAAVLEEMNRAVERATPDSVMFRKLSYEMHMWRCWWERSRGRTELATRSAHYFVDQDQPYYAAPLFVMLGDEQNARAQLERAREKMPHRQLGWYYTTMLLSAEERSHPVIRELERLMGLTPEWRLELCRRASTLPPSTGFACNPEHYSM